jgi:DNA polymerase-3 subunit delta
VSPVRAFVGDPFLARRAARTALDDARARAGVAADAVVRLGEGLSATEVADALGQGGLFGPAVLWLDLDEAFVGAGHTAARNAVLEALAAAGEAEVVALDASATPARQKRWRALGDLAVLPTPRYAGVARWVAQELKEAGVALRGDVAGALADAFGDDLPGLAGEVVKLALLGEPVTPERALEVAHRPAARSAFDVVDALAAGDAALALGLVRGLLAQGEAPVRVHAALAWHVELVARCTALALRDPGVGKDEAARALGTSPYPTGRALDVARRLDEPTLAAAVRATVAADVAMKTGRDPEWALESCVLTLVATLGAPVRGRA